MTTTQTPTMCPARIGSISSGTLRAPDLLNAFAYTLEGLVFINGEFLCLPENMGMRDSLNNLIGEVSDCLDDSGEEVAEGKDEEAGWLVENLVDSLNIFAPPFCFFGAHEGDGADFGFWPCIDAAKENCEFVSSRFTEFPESDFQGEWLHISDHGNCTLYVRTDGEDKEVWSIV
jgi:hypothetical protein